MDDPQPEVIWRACGDEISPELAAEFAEALERLRGHPPRLLTPLPFRVRVKLTARHVVDSAAIWLVDRGRFGAAERLWRLFGMWH
jgi:hypothetical protein